MRLSVKSLSGCVALAVLICVSGAVAAAQGPLQLMLPENQATRVSDHVWAIMGFPNIGIVVGDRATLVVDTGLGPRNGAIVAREAQKLSKGPVLYLTTTHYHPEHAAGEGGFPAGTIIVRPVAQEKELEANGMQFVEMFSSRSPQMKELLAGVTFRKPDITFEHEITLDLGGVTARLFWLGAAHTQGDELIDVEQDSTLISGDVVQNKVVPNLPDDHASMKGWVDVLWQLCQTNSPVDLPLPPTVISPRNDPFAKADGPWQHVLPDHSAPSEGSLVVVNYQFFRQLESRAFELKRQGKSADDTGRAVLAEFKTQYPDWQNLNAIPNVVKHIYAENP